MTRAPIGALRRRPTLERASLAADGSTLWTPVATLFAAITPVSGTTAEAGGGATGRVTHRIEIRRRDDVSSADRFVLGPRIFRIHAVRDPDETGARLLIDAEEENR